MPTKSRVVEAGHGDEAERAAPPADGRPEPGDEPPPAGPTEAEHYAGHLRESTSSILLHAAMGSVLKGIEWPAYKLYRDRLLADSGSPTDPVEVMLLEQLGLAHFCTGLLAAKATNAGQVDVCGAYASAYARVMAEFRRSSLALQAYRHANRQLARDPAKDVVPIEISGPADDPAAEKDTGNEQAVTMEETDAGEDIIPYPEPASIGARTISSTEAASDHPRGAGKAARRRAGDPPVGAVHRATK